MGTETIVDGHVFDFGTGICTKCGMHEVDYENQGEPICTGKKPKPDGTNEPRSVPATA
ncbi:MAG: hypothetical protein JO184_09715 [Gammaproteobacteria bacterium]|nr:hypothetical protein [Gammaproteobacteria bacterium]